MILQKELAVGGDCECNRASISTSEGTVNSSVPTTLRSLCGRSGAQRRIAFS